MPRSAVAAGDVLRLARVFLLGLEQRRRHQQMPVEQLPLGADLDRLVLFRPENLIRIAVEGSGRGRHMRAGAVEFGAHRVRRRRIGDIDAAVRHRLQRQAEVEVRHADIARPASRRDWPTLFTRAKAARLDVVVVEANAPVEDDHVIVVGAIDDVDALGVDGDLGRQAGQRRRRRQRLGTCIADRRR